VTRRRTPPQFVVRTTIATLTVVACLLASVLLTVLFDTRARVRASVSEKLDAGQRMLAALETRRAHEQEQALAALSENPTLKAAIDTYQAEIRTSDESGRRELITTIARELDRLAERLDPDLIAVLDMKGQPLAVAGRYKAEWMRTAPPPVWPAMGTSWVRLSGAVLRVASGELSVPGATVGALQIATALDLAYAAELSSLSGAATLVVSDGEVVASTLPPIVERQLTRDAIAGLGTGGTASVDGREYAVRALIHGDGAAVYALDSIDGAAAPAVDRASRGLMTIAAAAFALAGFASIWLARTIASPIGRLSRSIDEMTRSRTRDRTLPYTGASLEIDALTGAFNSMMQSVGAAEAQTRRAYVGTIRALAMALDARDPYTAGHSERVSAIAVAIARQFDLPEDEVEILRLGALLHDIGKIGISDAVLRKPGPLTDDEFEIIKTHPAVGARILRSLSFLEDHIPIVELHHEQPDGRGYPHGLRGDEIPLPARIVHVADAYDAMTTARAYRQGRPAAEAVRELWRCAGTQFDAEVVQALVTSLPAIDGLASSAEPAAGGPRLTLVHWGTGS
jgi:putative nucleotidyltransferase with HDIG domain